MYTNKENRYIIGNIEKEEEKKIYTDKQTDVKSMDENNVVCFYRFINIGPTTEYNKKEK